MFKEKKKRVGFYSKNNPEIVSVQDTKPFQSVGQLGGKVKVHAT
jgi:hypothetical protein